jgi:ribosomal protein L12E/L44/L45/RPP1/RPP2
MSTELVTVATYRTLPEAEAARLHLEAEGLTTFLADAETVAMDWLLANAVGNIKLQVPPAQAEAAAALLEQMHVKRKEREQHSEEDATSRCLSCGAELPENLTQCTECGWSYVGTDDA